MESGVYGSSSRKSAPVEVKQAEAVHFVAEETAVKKNLVRDSRAIEASRRAQYAAVVPTKGLKRVVTPPLVPVDNPVREVKASLGFGLRRRGAVRRRGGFRNPDADRD